MFDISMNKIRTLVLLSVLTLAGCSFVKLFQKEQDPVIRVGMEHLPASYDPLHAGTNLNAGVLKTFYQTPLEYDFATGSPVLTVGALLRLPESPDHGKTWHLELKKDLQFSGLKEAGLLRAPQVSAKDLAGTLLRHVLFETDSSSDILVIAGVRHWALRKDNRDWPSGIKIKSVYDLEITLEKADPHWVHHLTKVQYGIVPYEYFERRSFLENPVGSRGLQLKTDRQLNVASVFRGDTQIAELKSVSSNFALEAFRNGQMDLYIPERQGFQGVPSRSILEASTRAVGVQVKELPETTLSFLALNTKNKAAVKDAAQILGALEGTIDRPLLLSSFGSNNMHLSQSLYPSWLKEGEQSSLFGKSALNRKIQVLLPDIPQAKSFAKYLESCFAKGKVSADILFLPPIQVAKALDAQRGDVWAGNFMWDQAYPELLENVFGRVQMNGARHVPLLPLAYSKFYYLQKENIQGGLEFPFYLDLAKMKKVIQ